jgi:hypothetical protein
MGQIQQAMERDCCLIFEAMRRLIEGTCCLQGEENLCVWDLFGKLYIALSEHVEFEEAHVLPKLPHQERARHHAEHMRLRELIERARWEFECAEGNSFREVLRELFLVLKVHHENDPELSDLDLLVDRNLRCIAERAESAYL